MRVDVGGTGAGVCNRGYGGGGSMMYDDDLEDVMSESIWQRRADRRKLSHNFSPECGCSLCEPVDEEDESDDNPRN